MANSALMSGELPVAPAVVLASPGGNEASDGAALSTLGRLGEMAAGEGAEPTPAEQEALRMVQQEEYVESFSQQLPLEATFGVPVWLFHVLLPRQAFPERSMEDRPSCLAFVQPGGRPAIFPVTELVTQQAMAVAAPPPQQMSGPGRWPMPMSRPGPGKWPGELQHRCA